MTQFAALPTPFKCKNVYLTPARAVVGSIVWAFRRLRKPRCREMSARGYALHSVCPQLSFFFFFIVSDTDFSGRKLSQMWNFSTTKIENVYWWVQCHCIFPSAHRNTCSTCPGVQGTIPERAPWVAPIFHSDTNFPPWQWIMLLLMLLGIRLLKLYTFFLSFFLFSFARGTCHMEAFDCFSRVIQCSLII